MKEDLKAKYEGSDQIRSDQSLSRVRLFATPSIAARQASLSITNSQSSLRLMSIESVMPSSISSSVIPFSSCPQSLPVSESFPKSQLFAWGGQSTGVSASASVLPKNTQGWSPSEWTSWISLQSKADDKTVVNRRLCFLEWGDCLCYKVILTCMQVKKQQLEPDMGKWTGFKIGKGACQGYISSPCLFNLYAEHIMWNADLDKSQAGIKIAGRNTGLRYADDNSLMAESEEELKRASWWNWKRRVKKLA